MSATEAGPGIKIRELQAVSNPSGGFTLLKMVKSGAVEYQKYKKEGEADSIKKVINGQDKKLDSLKKEKEKLD